jgi:hypothetical protein
MMLQRGAMASEKGPAFAKPVLGTAWDPAQAFCPLASPVGSGGSQDNEMGTNVDAEGAVVCFGDAQSIGETSPLAGGL